MIDVRGRAVGEAERPLVERPGEQAGRRREGPRGDLPGGDQFGEDVDDAITEIPPRGEYVDQFVSAAD